MKILKKEKDVEQYLDIVNKRPKTLKEKIRFFMYRSRYRVPSEIQEYVANEKEDFE